MNRGKDIKRIFSNQGELETYNAKRVILGPYKNPQDIFYIKSGFVKMYSVTKRKRTNLYGIYRPEDIFPLPWEPDKFDKEIYYQSVTKTELYKITLNDFKQILSYNPKAIFDLIDKLNITIGFFLDRLDNLEIRISYPRIIRRLLFLAKRLGKKNGKTVIFQAPITQREIGDSTSVERETVSRNMNKLESKSFIKIKNHFIVINDISKLEKEFLRSIK